MFAILFIYMKAASVITLKQALKEKSKQELLSLCLSMAKFKKENKELLSYLLYDTENETGYIRDVKLEIESQFVAINYDNYHFVKKGVRKVLRNCKKYIRYSKKTITEIELLLHYSEKLLEISDLFNKNVTLVGIFQRQIEIVKKKIPKLHEDLQFDYNLEIKSLLEKVK